MAYDHIYKLISNPYQNQVHGGMQNDTIFNASRFLVNTFGTIHADGVNKAFVYYSLSHMATKFEAFKTARYGYDKL